jgi:glycosyltransferase involved in cell wall biosynthesis
MGGSNVTFIKNASDEAVAHHLAKAQAFLFAAHEDFGMTPVEALASGTPVIAYQAGGALDYVTRCKTGVFFDQQTVGSIIKAIQTFEKTNFNHQTVAKAAGQFSAAVFNKRVLKILEIAIEKREQA